tara:strand:- start:202 stop:447 length:246 start_codon:yes stop_codon:yes gene_type:complete
MQEQWIGKSVGATIRFAVDTTNDGNCEAKQNTGKEGNTRESDTIDIFTTRADTVYGVRFIGLSVDHPALKNIITPGKDTFS